MTNETSSISNPVPLSWVEKLFERMAALYGSKFMEMWRGTDLNAVKAVWAAEMGKVSSRELKRGYEALHASEWPPSLPQFLKMCKPPLDTVAAYYEAVNGVVSRERGEVGNWTHPAIFWASVTMSHDLKNMSYSSVKDRWERALSEQLAKAKWEPIPAPAPALPPPGKGRSDKANAERMLAQYRAGCKTDGRKTDRDWIGKVLERAKNGDESLPHISLVFAKMALKTEMD
jgi:hypothetical protein